MFMYVGSMSATWRRLFSVERRQGGAQRQYLWNVPNGREPDFSESYTHGQNIPISWNALNNSVFDLWLTTWNAEANPMALCLARAINLGHDGSLNLKTPNIPPETLSTRTRYVLRFKPQTKQGDYVPLDPELSSPAFFIMDSSQSARTESSSSSATTFQTAFPTTIPTPPPHTSTSVNTTINTPFAPLPSSSGSTSNHENMSSGQAAALAIGLILVVALLVAGEIAYLMWRRKRKRNLQQNRRLKNKSLYGLVHDPREKEPSSTTNTTQMTKAKSSTSELTEKTSKSALGKLTELWSPFSWARGWKWKGSAGGRRGAFTRVVTTSRDSSNQRSRKNSSKTEVDERETQEHKDRWTMFNSPYTGPWMLVSPELPGDSSWGHYDGNGGLVHELHASNGRRGPGTINSSLVELDAEGNRWEEQRLGGR